MPFPRQTDLMRIQAREAPPLNLPSALPFASQEPLSRSPSLLDGEFKVCTWSLSHKTLVSEMTFK